MKTIDPVEAIRLYDAGYSWSEAGRIIALLNRRKTPYWGKSVQRVVRAYERRAASRDEKKGAPKGACSLMRGQARQAGT